MMSNKYRQGNAKLYNTRVASDIIDDVTGSDTVYDAYRLGRMYRGEFEINLQHLIDQHGDDECFHWVDYYRSSKFRPRVKIGMGRLEYVQLLILQKSHPSVHSLNEIMNTCGHLWCCNPKHLTVR